MTNLICIVCPRGCHISVDNDIVTGNTCKRGYEYALQEVKNPTRMITSTVKIDSNIIQRLPVITSKPIPKNKIFDVMQEINKAYAKTPIHIKDIIIKDVLGLGVDIIATRNVLE